MLITSQLPWKRIAFNKWGLIALELFLFNNLINPAGDILYNTKPVAKQPSYILHWQKTNRLLHFYKQSNQSKSKPGRSSFLFLLEIHVKWAITPVADTKCLHTVLNFTILKKLWASGHNVVRYNTPAWGNRLQCVILLLVVVWTKKLNFSTFYWF